MICPKCGQYDCDFFTSATEPKGFINAVVNSTKEVEEFWLCSDCGTKFETGAGVPFAAADLPESKSLHYGNLANKSLLTKYKDYYYSVYFFDKKNRNGKHGFKAIKDNKLVGILKMEDVSDIIPFEDNIYFLNNTKKEEGELWRIKYDSNDAKKILTKQKPSQFLIYDGTIYYISISQKQALLKMQLNGDTSQVIITDRIGYFTICDGFIYYSNNDDNGNIYRVPLSDPKSKEKITHEGTATVGISGGGLQISNSGRIYFRSAVRLGLFKERQNISRVDIGGGEPEVFLENVAAFNIDGNRLFTIEGDRLIQYDDFESIMKRRGIDFIKPMSLPVINVLGDDIMVCAGLLYADAPVYYRVLKI